MRAICFALFCGTWLSSANSLDILEPKRLNDAPKVEILTHQDLLVQSFSVVFVTNTLHDPVADTLSQLLSGRPVPVLVFVAPDGILKDVPEGKIVVYREGRKFFYHGLNDATVILKYIIALERSGLTTIANKIDKMAFERTRGTRLVGYFAVGSNELAVFEEAEKLFGNQVAFFVVTDPLVAKHVKLNTTGQIYLTRELDKTAVICPQNPATLADIQRLLVQYRETFIKVTPMNAKDPSLSARPSILLVTDSSPLSLHLLKLVTRIQRNSTIELQSGKNSRILWIDLDDFPFLDVASLQIKGLTKLPGFGFWDPAKDSYEWLDLAVLNAAPADRLQEDLNLLLIKNFISVHSPASSPLTAPVADTAKTEL